MQKIQIGDGKGTESCVKVSNSGELVTRSLSYSTPIFNNLNVSGAAFSFFGPSPGMKFVITDVIADADRNIGNLGATVDIYEANAIDSTVIATQLLRFDMVKQSSKVLTALNFITTAQGKWLNAKTDDGNILLTISGFYVPVKN